MLEYRVDLRQAGEASCVESILQAAWDEFIECRVMDKETWVQNTLALVEQYPRYEIGLFYGDTPVGGLILTRDEDIHVGDCMCIMFQYVLPEHRHTHVSARCMRHAVRITRELGHSILAYSHRDRDWCYTIKYRRV